jgi:hypothetical protein
MHRKSFRVGFALSKLPVLVLGFLTIANAQSADKDQAEIPKKVDALPSIPNPCM